MPQNYDYTGSGTAEEENEIMLILSSHRPVFWVADRQKYIHGHSCNKFIPAPVVLARAIPSTF